MHSLSLAIHEREAHSIRIHGLDAASCPVDRVVSA
jgi:hypothetical protein